MIWCSCARVVEAGRRSRRQIGGLVPCVVGDHAAELVEDVMAADAGIVKPLGGTPRPSRVVLPQLVGDDLVDGDVPSGVDAVDLAVEGRVGQRGMVFGVLPLDEQPPLVGIPWVQAWVVLLADAGAEVGRGEHAAVQGVLRIGQVTMRVQTLQELSDGRGVFALVVGLAEVLAAVASDVEELGDGGLLQAGLLAGPVHPCGDHPRQCVAVGVVEDDLGGAPSRAGIRQSWPG